MAPPALLELYVEAFMSSFADELEATQRVGGAGGGADARGRATADVRLLADCIKAGADAFTAEEQGLYG